MKILQLIVISSVIMLGTNAFAACSDNQQESKADLLRHQMIVLITDNPASANELVSTYRKEVLPVLRGSLGDGGTFVTVDAICNTLHQWIQKTKE